MRRTRPGFLLFLTTALALAAAPAAAREGKTFPLAFTPSDDIQDVRPKELSPELLRVPLFVEPLSDARTGDRTVIAENREHSEPVVMRTASDVPRYVTDGVKTCLLRWGVSESPSATRRLKGELARLFVEETGRYRSEIQARFRLQDLEGKVLWQGTVVGTAEKYGRSQKPENYNEVITDTVMDLTARLLADPGFQAAWGGTKGADAGGGPAASRPAERPRRRLEPDAAKGEVLTLLKEGFDEKTVVEFARGTELTRALTASEMVDWKKAGVPQAVIGAFLTPAESRP